MAAALALIGTCSICLAAAALAVARLRLALSDSPAAALTFVVPGALLTVLAGALAARGELLAALPLATVATLCLAAGLLFAPTAATRFAEFERQFWTHVHDARR